MSAAVQPLAGHSPGGPAACCRLQVSGGVETRSEQQQKKVSIVTTLPRKTVEVDVHGEVERVVVF